MSVQKKGLGKGLSALFGDIEKKIDDVQIKKNTLAISDLQRNKSVSYTHLTLPTKA